ncbi:unnamed protein product [Pylaiella littoralis]
MTLSITWYVFWEGCVFIPFSILYFSNLDGLVRVKGERRTHYCCRFYCRQAKVVDENTMLLTLMCKLLCIGRNGGANSWLEGKPPRVSCFGWLLSGKRKRMRLFLAESVRQTRMQILRFLARTTNRRGGGRRPMGSAEAC